MSTTNFATTSRYYGIATATLQGSDGRSIVYLKRRFVPQPSDFALLSEYTVSGGERLDNIAAKVIGDPEQFWRICDANGAIRPEELVETPGATLRITLPTGIPGPSNA